MAVSPERAWEVFTAQMADWWPLHTHSIAAFDGSAPDELVVEPGVGGEIYEQTGGVRRHWARFEYLGAAAPALLHLARQSGEPADERSPSPSTRSRAGRASRSCTRAGRPTPTRASRVRATARPAGWELVAASFASALD